MKGVLVRVVGIVLILAGVAGLVFSAAGLVVLIRVEATMGTALDQQVDLINRAVSATSDGLQVAYSSLVDAADTVRSLQSTVSGVGVTVQGSIPTFSAISDLLGNELPATVENAQVTLSSAATSAKGVDDFLGALSKIPFVGTGSYNPDVPLSESLSQLSASLNDIPDAMRAAEAGLTITSANLQALQGQFSAMADTIGRIAESLDRGRAVLTQYQGVTAELQKGLTSVRESLPDWLRWARWGLSLLLVWLGVAQLALITQGWELVTRSRRRQLRT